MKKTLLIFTGGILVGLAAPFLYFTLSSSGSVSSLPLAGYHANRQVIEDYARAHGRYCTVTTEGNLVVRKWVESFFLMHSSGDSPAYWREKQKRRNEIVKHPSECGARIELAN